MSPTYNTVVVDQNGQADFRSIGDAVRAVAPPARIRVTPGTYRESVVIDKDIELIGYGPRQLVVIETRNSDCLSIEADHAIVRSITLRSRGWMWNKFHSLRISQGQPHLEDCDISGSWHSCVEISGRNTAPVISHSRIHSGQSVGVEFLDKACGTMEYCEIRRTNIGVDIGPGCDPALRHCIIRKNNVLGVQFRSGALGTIDDCDIFSSNRGIDVAPESRPAILRCKVHECWEGMRIGSRLETRIVGCEIFRNRFSGVVVTSQARPCIQGCRILQNRVGMIVTDGAQAEMGDTDISSNEEHGVEIKDGARLAIHGCSVKCNGIYGLYIDSGGGGTIEMCEFAGNKRSNWAISAGCPVEMKANSG